MSKFRALDDWISTLKNKVFNLADNTLTGTTAQFNTALSDGSFATLDGTETLTNKTLTDPKIGTLIKDVNGNTWLAVNAVASAVNYGAIQNNTAGGGVTWYVDGSDTNIHYVIQPKGSGSVQIIRTGGGTDTGLTVGGSSSDINLNLESKGTGRVKAEGGNIVNYLVAVPSTSTSTGKIGQLAMDSSFLYGCYGANQWGRIAWTSTSF